MSSGPATAVAIYLSIFSVVAPGFGEAAPLSLLRSTAHGAEQMATRLGPVEAFAVEGGAQTILKQSDGARVFIQEVAPGKFNVVIKNGQKVVSVFRHLRQGALDRLARNYGWH
jgi:hypothetical protein